MVTAYFVLAASFFFPIPRPSKFYLSHSNHVSGPALLPLLQCPALNEPKHPPPRAGPVACRERLGGPLNSYYREAT
jgi:hypothetical protein